MFLEGKTLELMIAAVVALVVVGPKDLPILLRRVGQFMARLRGMAAEFRASFDEMARQSELDELRKEVAALRQGQFSDIAAQAQGPEMTRTFDEIHQGLADVGVQLHPPMSYQFSDGGAPPEPMPAEPAPAPKPRARKPAAKAASAKRAPPKRKAAAAKPAARPRPKTTGPGA
ncbi:MAG TPA: Sec-independent protein translocase protein TatB [Phenylobacterium sp.]|uniref:Sec-independent protein translocase protein TatB n=1 Tax=Phenylobacterium sp. TaxID=1871053 RepID=UPI002BCE2814|nr:Sec-independent protein translocase protein TatB [Phenylobacterium sp.]HSV01968.1 Sec-independent protein translocase protein TatB [Phenylobacterium sp.]